MWLFKLKFEKQVTDTVAQQEILLNGFNEIKTDENLKEILCIILNIGNLMNAGNKLKGQADGYYLDALSKTTSIKDVNGLTIM